MPQFDIKLDDGRSIRVEGERAPTDDEASQIIQEQFGAKSEQPKSSALGSFGRAAATGVVPAAAGAGGFALGFEAGIPLAPFAGPAAPAVPFVTGAIGAGLASFGTGKAQQAIIHKAAPAFEQQQAQDIQEHPVASAAGNIAAALPTFELNPGQSVRGLAAIPAVIKGTANVAQRKALAATAVQAGTQAGLTTAQTLATERRIPTAGEFAEAGVSALIYGNPRIKALLPRSVAAAQQATGAKPNASSQRQAAEIHGNVPPLAAEGAGQVPVEEGSAGVQSQAQEEAPGVQQQVLRLTPEDQAHIDAERGSVDVPVEVRAPTENEPFAQAKAGQIASIDRQKGTIVINPEEFSGWLNEDMRGLTPERKRLAVRSLLAEERNHLATSQEDAAGYWNSLSAPERLIEQKLYTTRFRGRPDVSPTDLGFEAIRRRMQRLARMDSTETAAAAGAERWGLKSLEVLNDTIRGIRETLGTRASKEGLAILDKVQGNLDAAKAAVTGAEPASLRRKSEKETQTEFFLPPMKEGAVERPGATDVGAKPIETAAYLTADKVNWERMERKGAIRERPFRPITDAEAANPKALSVILSRGAREAGSNRPESHTRNVTALFDRYTGRIDVVSTYPHSRKGVMLADPSLLSENASRPHRQLEALLTRYKPIYSISLKESVQNFHERFSSMQDFQQRFGNAATEESAKRQGVAPTQAPAGAGKAAAFQAEQFTLPVETPAISPPESAEAGAIHDFFQGQLPKTQAEMQAVMTRGAAKASLQTVSGIKKMMEFEETRDPTLTSQQALTKALDKIYENLTQSTDREGFVRRTMGRFAEPPIGANERVAAAEAQKAPHGTIQGQEPASIRRIRDPIEDKFFKTVGQIRGMFARHEVKQNISAITDRANNEGIPIAQQARRAIEQPSSSAKQKRGNPKDLRAARAVNAVYSPSYRPAVGEPAYDYSSPSRNAIAHPDPNEFPTILKMTANGAAKAEHLLANPTDAALAEVGLEQLSGMSRGQIVTMAEKWLSTAKALGEEIKYASAHFGEKPLMETTVQTRTEINEELAREREGGQEPNQVDNYLQGLYQGEMYGDHSVTFAEKTLGKAYGKPKTFANVYEAIEAGPYIPVFNNVADSVAHRIRSGLSSIITDQAFRAPLEMTDPVSKAPIAIEAELIKDGGYVVPGGNLQYKLVYPNNGGAPLAVREGYVNLMKDLFGRSGLADTAIGKGILKFGAFEKHATLAGDIYHLSKMAWYALAIAGRRAGFKGGFTALEFKAKDMPEAVRRGVISQGEADWALEPHRIILDGEPKIMTRQEILQEMQKTNLNVGRIQDAMYRHFIDKLDIEIGGRKWGIGAYNKFLFDKWTRGFMAQSAVEEFMRLHKAAPNIDARTIMKRVGSDLNTQFGSSGKQGLVKNPTLRDIAQLGFLAPQWVGTRIATEARFLSRLATTPYVLATKGPGAAHVHFGPIGRGVGRGILTMFALTQAINLITRHKFTFQNDEEEHKLDAWIPDIHGGPGHWISPLSVFLEITHDVARYMMSGDKQPEEAIARIAQNKLGPLGRSLLVGVSGYTPMGQKIKAPGGRFVEAAKALVPTPVTFSAAAREVGHAVAPNTVAPNAPGALQRQAYGSMGIKSEIADTATKRISRLAQRFVDENGLRHTGFDFLPTDQPDYAKVRMALQRGDNAGAQKLLKAIGKPDDHVIKVMRAWRDRPWTGSKKAEAVFISTLTDAQKDVYAQAQIERQQLFDKFSDLMLSGK